VLASKFSRAADLVTNCR